MKEEIIRFIKFSIVGVANTAVTFITYTVLVALGVNYLIANIIGYAVGTLNSYFFNRKWVFNSEKSYRNFIKFVIVNVFALGISTGLLYCLVHYLHLQKILAQIVVIPFTMVFNFIGNKIWTFSRR